MRKVLRLFLSLFILFSFTNVKAQSCFNVNAGRDTTISCMQPCFNLKAKVPDVKSSEDYQVVPIEYQPFPFINPSGVVFNPTYIDDSYSGVVDLPFTFCFYGNNYTQCVVGTNGILSFELSNANTFNSWFLNLGTVTAPGSIQPIPYLAGGTPNDPNVAYYPRACIMGPYHDIDPEVTQPQPPKKKMEYIVVGNAPCRKFVLNFFKIPYYNCPTEIVTQQMVLYEGTGIIDIFLENKPRACATSTNEGRAILGIQNWERDKAVAVNGRNNTVWTAAKEGWRFIPNGTTSLLSRVELYKNNALISTVLPAAVTNLGTGELEASFDNICQSEDSMSYVIKAFYKKCDDLATETEGSDTMIVYKTLNPFSKVVNDALCNAGNGKITITAPVASNIEYSINGGGTWQGSNIFNVPAGNYTVIARVIGSNCRGSVTATITEPTALNAFASTAASTCAGNDGIINITASGGTINYFYSIDNGVTYQNNNVFLTPPGNYPAIKIKDANGCITTTSALVDLDDQMFLNAGADTTICAGQSITFSPLTNTGTNTFRWTPAQSLNDNSIKNSIATPVDTTRYFLNAAWGVCNRTDDILVSVLHKPVPFAGKDTTICDKTVGLLNGRASNLSGTVNYAWSPAAKVSPANTGSVTARSDTTQLYTLTVTDNYGCNFFVSDDVLVTMRPPVPAFAGNDTNAVYGVPHQLFGSGGKSYLWTPSSTLNSPFLQNPMATLYNDSHFSLLVTDDIGCTNTDDVFIKVYKGPTYYIPNAFTPNGDGANDIFRATPVGISVTDYFAVYNRMGEMVFITREWLKGWDGTYKGKKADAGTYVWMIKGSDKYGKVVEMKGTVILIR
jgi:gliding motility-associated-like protein